MRLDYYVKPIAASCVCCCVFRIIYIYLILLFIVFYLFFLVVQCTRGKLQFYYTDVQSLQPNNQVRCSQCSGLPGDIYCSGGRSSTCVMMDVDVRDIDQM